MNNNNNLQNVMEEISPTSKRILEVLEEKGITGYRLEKDNSGIKQTQISHLKSGRNEPSEKLIKDFLKYFPDISEVWIKTGYGEKYQSHLTINGNDNFNDFNGNMIFGDRHNISIEDAPNISNSTDVNRELLEIIKKKDEQIDRLLELLSKK